MEPKAAAVKQWNANPCGEHMAAGETGTRAYFESLDQASREHDPWMADAFNYSSCDGLDILDVGCGQGIDLARYARAGARVVGVDITPRHIDLARAHLATMNLRGQVMWGDAEALPFADATFDRVSSNGVLHHTPNTTRALRELYRVLRPHGEARIAVYNRASAHYWINQILLEGILKRGLMRERSMRAVMATTVEYSTVGARPLVKVYSPRTIRRMMQIAAFRDVSSAVCQYRRGDAFLLDWVRSPMAVEWIGRTAGWYVVCRGLR